MSKLNEILCWINTYESIFCLFQESRKYVRHKKQRFCMYEALSIYIINLCTDSASSTNMTRLD